MRPVESPSSMISSSACASSSPSSPSWTAATRSASRPRRSSSCTSASTACASPSATSAAAGFSFTAGLVIGVLSENGVELVLEAAGLDRAMDAAFLRRVRLPPPAPGAVGLAGTNGARARCAADRRVALVVERVVRHVVLAHVVPDLVLRPLGEWVQLHDRAVVVIDLDLADIRARRPLVAAKPRDPGVKGGEMLRQRSDFANVAAKETVLHRFAEEVEAFSLDHAADVLLLGREDAEIQAGIALAQLRDQRVRLRGQPAGVDGEEANLGIDPVGHVDDRNTVDLERGRDADARAETLDGPFENRLGLLALESDGELARFQLVEKLVGAHAAASTSRLLRAGSRRASSPSSSSERRRWNSVKDSSSSRPSSQPRIRPSTAASSPSLGTRRKTGRAIAGSGPSEPRTKMS